MKFDDKFTTLYVCERCNERHEDEDDAEECCKPEVSQVYVCQFCTEEFDGFGAWRSAKAHLQVACKTVAQPASLHERYIEEVLMEGKPCLGEWSYEFAIKNDLEIV